MVLERHVHPRVVLTEVVYCTKDGGRIDDMPGYRHDTGREIVASINDFEGGYMLHTSAGATKRNAHDAKSGACIAHSVAGDRSSL